MIPKNTWMVRSDGGNALGLFEQGVVGIHYGIPDDLSGKSLDQIRELYNVHNPGQNKYKAGGAAGMLDRIVNTMQVGDGVVTYDPGTRHYWIGTISSAYYFAPDDTDLPHRRKVEWHDTMVSRDDLSLAARNSLGPTMTLFSVSPEIWQEMIAAQQGAKPLPPDTNPSDEEKVELVEEKKTLIEKARERLKDRIVNLDDGEMEELLAAVLRAMGFRTRVSAKGPDRGVDVLASPDGLGLQEPRIKCEVKHRKNTIIGAGDVRSFLGALRAGDRGIYLSTGGFTR
jgi:restriction system protein